MFPKKYVLLLSGFLFLLLACTPKTPIEPVKEPTTTPQAQVPKPGETLSPCTKFSDIPNGDEMTDNYIIYRDMLKAKDWDGAFKNWKKVYAAAPAADGRRNTVYADGIRFYEHYLYGKTDSTLINAYVDTIFTIYDEIERCYPEGGYVKGRKGFDLFYKYPWRATKEEQFNLFKESIEIDGGEMQYFVVNPFTSLLVTMHDEGKISDEEAKKYEQMIRQTLEKGLADCTGKDCEKWEIIQEYAPARLEYFERVKGFYPCEYYTEKYYPEYQESPEDCDVMRTVLSRMKYGGCDVNMAQYQEIYQKYKTACFVDEGPSCYSLLEDAKYREAIECFEKQMNEATDKEKKAKNAYIIAQIYYSHLKNFGQARKYARKASSFNPNWGKPYLLVGRLYASSGPLCGPGRGWDSQIVTWPAIDEWNKAKRVDPSVAAEANKFINRYTKFMPSRGDIFQRGLKEGATFKVGCWIQETTTIRAAP